MQIDFNGIAAVILALGTFLTVVINSVTFVLDRIERRRANREQAAHKDLLCSIKEDTKTIRKVDTIQ